MIPRSIARDKKNTGTVIFVGKATRFATNDIPIAEMANAMATALFPVVVITNKVNGVNRQPWANRIAASHAK